VEISYNASLLLSRQRLPSSQKASFRSQFSFENSSRHFAIAPWFAPFQSGCAIGLPSWGAITWALFAKLKILMALHLSQKAIALREPYLHFVCALGTF